MSFGKLNTFIEIGIYKNTKDSEGFVNRDYVTLVQVRADREGRHGSQRWANLAAFLEATDIFRFRAIPGFKVTCDHLILCDSEVFEITSVENVKGRGMYVEVQAKKTVTTSG